MSKTRSWRGNEWCVFADEVDNHIENYTVPQYGDYPHDQVTKWDSEDCMKSIQRYAARLGKGKRGMVEQERDLLKIAHYACMCLTKLRTEEKGDGS